MSERLRRRVQALETPSRGKQPLKIWGPWLNEPRPEDGPDVLIIEIVKPAPIEEVADHAEP